MKFFNKRSVSMLSLLLGIALFTGAAFADLALGSGYQMLKDSVKETVGAVVSETNYTIELGMEIFIDEQLVTKDLTVRAADDVQDVTLNYSSSWSNWNGEREYGYQSWYYEDFQNEKQLSWYTNSDDNVLDQVYYLYSVPGMSRMSSRDFNPFTDSDTAPMVADLEKVFDALVGNLSTLVQVGYDGSDRLYSGTLNESQVPMIIQALTTYISKEASGAYDLDYENNYGYSRSERLPFSGAAKIESVVGQARADEHNHLQEASLDILLTGSDVAGQPHSLRMIYIMNMKDVGTTSLNLPDLTGKNVENSEYKQREERFINQLMSSSLSGEYFAEIILDDGEKVVKIGERYLSLQVSEDEIRGVYTEKMKDEYLNYNPLYPVDLEFVLSNKRDTSEMGMDGDVEYSVVTTSSLMSLPIKVTSSSSIMAREGHFTAQDASGRTFDGYISFYSDPGALVFDTNFDKPMFKEVHYLPLRMILE